MARIVANMATFPKRVEVLPKAVKSVLPQVDVLNLVLNDFDSVPDWIAAEGKINAVIPAADTKDTGKFLVPVAADDWLFTVDDDIVYPADYVVESIRQMETLARTDVIGGYHGSIYRKPRMLPANPRVRRWFGINPNYLATSRRALNFFDGLRHATVVHQLGTGTCMMRGRHAPVFADVKDAQRFIDVRFARRCFERGLQLVCLPRVKGWMAEAQPETGESIFDTFTQSCPAHVTQEIYDFAFKMIGAGEQPATRTGGIAEA